MIHTFYCHYCNRVKSHKSDISTGYGVYQDEEEKTCFDCCAIRDREEMINTGTSRALPLYLTENKNVPMTDEKRRLAGLISWPAQYRFSISNWPGTLKFNVQGWRKSRHNWAGSRYDVWFNGPDSRVWHGVNYGENTQIVHCKRTKERF